MQFLILTLSKSLSNVSLAMLTLITLHIFESSLLRSGDI